MPPSIRHRAARRPPTPASIGHRVARRRSTPASIGHPEPAAEEQNSMGDTSRTLPMSISRITTTLFLELSDREGRPEAPIELPERPARFLSMTHHEPGGPGRYWRIPPRAPGRPGCMWGIPTMPAGPSGTNVGNPHSCSGTVQDDSGRSQLVFLTVRDGLGESPLALRAVLHTLVRGAITGRPGRPVTLIDPKAHRTVRKSCGAHPKTYRPGQYAVRVRLDACRPHRQSVRRRQRVFRSDRRVACGESFCRGRGSGLTRQIPLE